MLIAAKIWHSFHSFLMHFYNHLSEVHICTSVLLNNRLTWQCRTIFIKHLDKPCTEQRAIKYTLLILFPCPCLVGGRAAAHGTSPDWRAAPSNRGGVPRSCQSKRGPRRRTGERLLDGWEQQLTPHVSHLWGPRQRTQGLQQPVLWIW